jgi:hypothetical protein
MGLLHFLVVGGILLLGAAGGPVGLLLAILALLLLYT